jgi:hypothetical protein
MLTVFTGDFTTAKTGTGIADVVAEQLKIFTNPAKNEIVIENGGLSIEYVEIYDLSGHKMLNCKLSTGNYQLKINVSSLVQGIYLVKIYTDKGLIINKIIKE